MVDGGLNENSLWGVIGGVVYASTAVMPIWNAMNGATFSIIPSIKGNLDGLILNPPSILSYIFPFSNEKIGKSVVNESNLSFILF